MTGRAYVALNWERAADGALSPYLTIARHDQPVERIPLTTRDVVKIMDEAALIWLTGIGRRVDDHNRSPGRPSELPCFIGAFGE